MLRLLTVISAALVLAACASTPETPALPASHRIDAQALALMERESVVGMAVAVIDRGEIVHVGAYGYANREQQRPLQTDTIMYGASLTKAAFAYMVMQLVEEGRLDLERSIADYLPRPLPEYEGYTDLDGDERWRLLTPRILLTHRSGFANLRFLEEDRRLRFHFTPGERYAYSNEGFWALQTTLEEGLGLDIKEEMQRRVWDRFGMTRTSMQWRDDFASDLADGYALDGSFEPHDRRDNVAAAGSMDTTIADQARLWASIVRGDGLSAASRAEFIRGQFAVNNARQFPTLATETDPRGAEINLSAAPGLMTFNDPQAGLMWFRGGHNEWTGNIVICQQLRRRCVVFLGNSVRAEIIYEELARFILGDTAMPWWWMYDY